MKTHQKGGIGSVFFAQQLDSHQPAQGQILRQIDFGQAAFA
jgi:hypothetical protein